MASLLEKWKNQWKKIRQKLMKILRDFKEKQTIFSGYTISILYLHYDIPYKYTSINTITIPRKLTHKHTALASFDTIKLFDCKQERKWDSITFRASIVPRNSFTQRFTISLSSQGSINFFFLGLKSFFRPAYMRL